MYPLSLSYLHEGEVFLLRIRRVVSLDDDIKVAVRVSAVALVGLDDARERIHQEGGGSQHFPVPGAGTDEGDVLQFIFDLLGLSVRVSGRHSPDLSVDGSVDSHASGEVLLSKYRVVVIFINHMDLHLDLLKFLNIKYKNIIVY